MPELRGGLFSTVVGSFPYRIDKNLMKNENWQEVEEIRKTSTSAVEFQLEAGIEYPSDGQLFDMVEMYIQPLIQSGFLETDRRINGKPPSDHPSLD
ncbi:MAG: hypothetical protein ACE5HY_04345, partial [Candidatus Hydrothermarchaeales archaeon]